jgi:hypothetical protein
MDITIKTAPEALHALWADTLHKAQAGARASWHEQQICVAGYGVGMEEALNYLCSNKPDFETFSDWIAKAGILPARPAPYEAQVLTNEDKAHWERDGYLVIKDAVTPQACEAARNAIWEYLGADAGAPETWYQISDGKRGMMLRLFQHEALAEIRYSPKIRKVYEELYGTNEIFLPVDKVSFNPPENGRYHFAGSPLHWDVSLSLPSPYELQGFVYLTDTGETDGAFHCVPGFHNSVHEWLASLPAGCNPRDLAPALLSQVAVPGHAGDLVIWHQALPHCATPNMGKTPRMVQYVAYKPLQESAVREWI